jgi:hypothetical protein
MVGKAGLMQVMEKAAKGGMRYQYRRIRGVEVERVFEPGNIARWSNKIASVCRHAMECDGILLVYTRYIEGGAVPIALALEEHGFNRYNDERGNNSSSNMLQPVNVKRTIRGRYTLITGNNELSSAASIQSAISAATVPGNKDGSIIKVIIITNAGAEGLDFKNVRQVHILDPWYNLSLLEQIIGRAVRNCSHVDLPFQRRNVCIFIHGTLLTGDSGVEAIDVRLLRYAEDKAKRIGNVNNILKKHAIDCNLNSEYNIPSFKDGAGTITQLLTTLGDDGAARSIMHNANIMPRTDACDYQDVCDSACEPAVDMTNPSTGTDADTYDMAFLTLNSERVIHRIRSLFKERFFYSEAELIGAINQVRTYPDEQIFTALNILIDDPIEFITDYYGRRGRLVNIGNYYLFQPEGVSDHHIGIRERVMPLEDASDYVEYNQLPNPNMEVPPEDAGGVAALSSFDATMGKLENAYIAVTSGSTIKHQAVDSFLQHATEIYKVLRGQALIPPEAVLDAIMAHYLDAIDYEVAVEVANNAKRKHDTDPGKKAFLNGITKYFNRYIIPTRSGHAVAVPSEKLTAWSKQKVTGLLKTGADLENDYVENSDFMILEDGEWTVMTDRVRSDDGVGKELFKWCDALRKKITTTTTTTSSSVNNVVGCMKPEADAFVFKMIDVTVSSELKGAVPTKRPQIENTIVQLLALVGIDEQNRQSGEIIAYVKKSILEPLAVLLEIILRAYDIMEPKPGNRNRWFFRPCEIQAIAKINQMYKKNKK